MIKYIFRKSDNVFAGAVFPPHSIDVELDNLTKSELGGRTTDYRVVQSAKVGVGICSLVDGVVVFSPYPVDPVKASRNAKLLALGLTQEEIDAV